jgi:(2Fe-2S) ferredoxin/predicted O-methyltransferase YrrM
MQIFPYHVFVCDQQKPEGVPCCSARGSASVIDALRAEVGRQGLTDKVQITVCGSIGLCERGPNIVVYPEGIWYSGVQPSDIPEIVESHFGSGRAVERLLSGEVQAVRAEIETNRARMIGAMKAKEASGALPDPLQQTVRAFQESRTVLTAIELDLFTALGNGGTAAEVALHAGTDGRATEMLLNALVSMGLLTKNDGTFANTPASSRYLAAGGRDDNRAALMHTAHLWLTWSGLTESVRTGTPARRDEMPERGEKWTEAFIAAMHRNASERAGPLVQAVGPESVKRMLDVGGGSGACSIAFARANPDLSSEVLDLATVTPICERYVSEAQMSHRVKTRIGDLRTGNLGEDYDLVLVSAICHMLSPQENQNLIARAWDALSSGGRLVVQDFILNADKTSPKFAALFSLNMLVGTAAGASYSESEYRAWFEGARFKDVRVVRLPGPAGLIIGTKPA